MKKLIIVDLSKNYDFNLNSCNYILINRGLVKFSNSIKLNFNINKEQKLLADFKKKIKKFFFKINIKLKKSLSYIDPLELEFFNLRNDKYGYLDKMFVFYCLKKKEFHKKFKVEVLTDNQSGNEIFNDIFGSKTKVQILGQKNNFTNETSFLFLKYIKFILKAMYFILLNNLILKNFFLPENEDVFFSLFPYFFKDNNINLYGTEKKNYLNFSLTDETHLNLKPKNFYSHLIKLSKNEKIFSIERNISFIDLILSIKKFYFEKKKIMCLSKKNFHFQGINCYSFLFPHISTSFLNRAKLFIYEPSLENLYNKYKPINFHYFLFEYNFGFFLKNKLKKIKKFIGYQHGIYTKNLMWLYLFDYLNQTKFFPHKIICNRKKSLNVYKKHNKNVILTKKINNFNLKINISNKKNEKNILVFLGQHDIDDSLHYFLNNKEFINKKIFLKLHPNNKKLIKFKSKNFYFINELNKLKKYKVFLSPTTTLIYDFKEKKIKFNLIKFNYKINLWS